MIAFLYSQSKPKRKKGLLIAEPIVHEIFSVKLKPVKKTIVEKPVENRVDIDFQVFLCVTKSQPKNTVNSGQTKMKPLKF